MSSSRCESMAEPVHRNALQPGFEVLWYRIESILGQGGFGITYLAYDPNLDQQVAIKEYLPIELAVREGDHSVHPVSENHGDNFRWGLERFISEARTLAKFDHPNIVRVLSVFEQNNTAYMPMRYEQGASLQALLPRRGTLEEDRLMKILLPVLGGLRVVHDAGFVHRDIKPANIFIREDGSPVLLDFGSARQALGVETKTLTSLVSPGYAPFEQYYSKSDRQGPWTDIYGLGATMYRAVAGVPPMDAVDRSEGLLKNSVDPIVPATQIGAGRYSTRFLEAIDRSIQFDENARPQNVAEWLALLEVPDEQAIAARSSAAPMAAAAASAMRSEASRTVAVERTPITGGPESAAPTAVSGAASGPLSGAATAPTEVAPSGAAESPSRDAQYAAFIGPKRTDYYLARFARFDQRGFLRRASCSWPGGPVHLPVDAAPAHVPVGVAAVSGGDLGADGGGADPPVDRSRRQPARTDIGSGACDGVRDLARTLRQCPLPSTRPQGDGTPRSGRTTAGRAARLAGETRRHVAARAAGGFDVDAPLRAAGDRR